MNVTKQLHKVHQQDWQRQQQPPRPAAPKTSSIIDEALAIINDVKNDTPRPGPGPRRISRTIVKAWKATTINSTASHLEAIRASGEPPTHKGLMTFLDRTLDSTPLREGRMKALLNAFRTAQIIADPDYNPELRLRYLVRGLVASHKATPKKPLGSITPDMFARLIEHMRLTDPYDTHRLQLAAIFHIAYAFRSDQIESLKYSNFNRHPGSKHWIYTGDRHKATTGKKEPPEQHTPMKRYYEYINAELDQLRNDMDEQIFSNYDEAKLRIYIRETASKHNWPAELDFSGPHCFRRGSIGNAMASGGIKKAMSRSAHRTKAMTFKYAKPNEEKIHDFAAQQHDPEAFATQQRVQTTMLRKLDEKKQRPNKSAKKEAPSSGRLTTKQDIIDHRRSTRHHQRREKRNATPWSGPAPN